MFRTTRRDVSAERPEQYMRHKIKGTVVTSGYASESPNVSQKHRLAAVESVYRCWLPLTLCRAFSPPRIQSQFSLFPGPKSILWSCGLCASVLFLFHS